jgi:CheY-like chemotaxis protein
MHDHPDHPATVLVVDDNPHVLEGMRTLLENHGYRVLVAGSGRAALTLLRSIDERPGLVILDLAMSGMDGWDFRAEQLRDERLAGIPVIVASADPLASLAHNMGVSAVMRKPVDPKQLLAAVASTALPAPQPEP